MKNVLSIDFSLNYTACCYINNNELNYASFHREQKLTKKQKQLIEDLSATGNFYHRSLKEVVKTKNYSDNELNKIKDASLLSESVLEIIKNNAITDIILEGFSFGSSGLRSLDIGGYAYILRTAIYKGGYGLEIISPKTVKKLAGSGNNSKFQMFEAYKNNILNDDMLNDCKIRNFILGNLETIVNKEKIIEPVCGLIDAYFLLKGAKK